MTYLELCQAVAEESGTVTSLPAPSAVTGQTDRLLRIVRWVRDSWTALQVERSDWRWMKASFSKSATSGTKSYSASDWSLDARFAEWADLATQSLNQWSVYKTADGQDQERNLIFVPWDRFHATFLIGTYDNGSPVYFSISPDDEVYLHPTPDDTYTVRGWYQKSPQILAADSDEPEMPSRYHDAIKYRALIRLCIFDEEYEQVPGFELLGSPYESSLLNSQTPAVRMGSALA